MGVPIAASIFQELATPPPYNNPISPRSPIAFLPVSAVSFIPAGWAKERCTVVPGGLCVQGLPTTGMLPGQGEVYLIAQ